MSPAVSLFPDSCAQDLPPVSYDYLHPQPVGLVTVVPDEIPGKLHSFILCGRQYDFVRVREFDGAETGTVGVRHGGRWMLRR